MKTEMKEVFYRGMLHGAIITLLLYGIWVLA